MAKWEVVFTKQAKKDSEKIIKSKLDKKVRLLINLLQDDPFQKPPEYKRLLGDLDGAYSQRINIKHRLIYQVHEGEKIIKIIRMWTHYE